MKLNWKKDNNNNLHKFREVELTDGSVLVLYFMDRRNGWCLYRNDKNGDQIGDSIWGYYRDMLNEAKDIAQEINRKDNNKV